MLYKLLEKSLLADLVNFFVLCALYNFMAFGGILLIIRGSEHALGMKGMLSR
jgi:hypothetical protein